MTAELAMHISFSMLHGAPMDRTAGRGWDESPASALGVAASDASRWAHRLAVIIATGLGATAAFGFVSGDLRVAVYFTAFSMVAILGLALRPSVPGSIQLLLALAMALNAPGWTWKWLDRIYKYDDIAHLVTTAAFVAVAGSVVLQRHWPSLRRNLRLYTAFLITAAITGGVLWEIYEWICDNFVAVPPHTMSIDDTMEDLLADVIGALWGGMMGVLAVVRRKARQQKMDRASTSSA